MSELRVGAFRLLRPIGEGGMATVWGGLHAASDLAVAVKILTAQSARDPTVRTLFRNEVRAVAKLSHPGIVSVLDFGEIGAPAAAASDGRLEEGMPYFVMEYAGGGSLGKRRRRWSWATLRRLLVALLDGLGHAHARGVLHRDLKPGNILLAGTDVLRGGVKLTDFGIAWLAGAGSGDTIAGTPQYMAPEQHSGDFGNQGPWTDLYALGCLAWRIVGGRTPFAHHEGPGVARAHLFERPPVLEPRFPVPPDFEALLRTMLHKDPHARFQCCADVAAALQGLADLDDDTEAEDLGDQDEDATAIAEDASGPVNTLGAGQPAGDEPAPTVIATLATEWRRAEAPRDPARLRGAGLSLFALREIPLFGREKQREILWKGLRAVHEQGVARAVLVRGPSGAGKTHLVEWLMHRAHEVAGIQALYVRGDQIVPALAAHFGIERVDETDRLEVLTDRLRGAPDHAALAGVLARAFEGQVVETEAFRQVVRQLVDHRSATRPFLLVVDDAHEAAEVLEIAREVCEAERERAEILVVLVARDDEGLAQRPDVEDRITRVLTAGRAKGLKLGPLEEPAMRQLLEHLGLAGPLVARVAERSAGNPHFAVQLVGDWVQRGLLEPSADGFVLAGGAEPPIPDGLHDIWSTRISRLLATLPSVAEVQLERAAAFGPEVVLAEWERAADDPSRGRVSDRGRQIRREIVEKLLDARWVEEHPTGFAFVHPMLRESLERRARKANRWAGHHQALATMYMATGLGDPGKVGVHLLEAGRPAEAVPRLFEGFDQVEARFGSARAGALLLPMERAMAEAGLPETDPLWAGLWRRQSVLLRSRRRYDEAIAAAERARAHAEARADEEDWARAADQVSQVQHHQGDLEGALATLQKAVARLLRAQKKGALLVRLLTTMTSTARLMNRLDDAERWATQAIGVLERGAGDPGSLAVLEGELAVIATRRRQWKAAIEQFERAMPVLEREGNARKLADVMNNYGDCLKNVGRWADAEKAFVDAARLLEGLAQPSAVPRLNLLICQIHVARYEAAREASHDVERAATGLFAALATLARVTCNAALGDVAAVERELQPAVERIRRGKLVEPDIVWLAEHAADALHRLGTALDQEVAFLYLAREQLDALGDAAGVARITRRLGDAPP